MSDTAMASAMKCAGVNKDENDFLAIIARIRNNGVTYERAVGLLRHAYGLSSSIQASGAKNGQTTIDAVQNGDGGQQISANTGQMQHSTIATPDKPIPVSAHSRKRPNGPSTAYLSAAKQGSKKIADKFWERKLGNILEIGKVTKLDLINFQRKTTADRHVTNRLMTEIAWPDIDKTPLMEIASKEQIGDIIKSGYAALQTMEITNA